ncbi:hypothetical protein V6N13_067737 [Hibiscus sabdariffa]|uniref:Fiber protein Fb17 n=1 Tax=Hibiscus sabdariffa TaxID=183260 RepID=A0ABR2DUA4_9ROSI
MERRGAKLEAEEVRMTEVNANHKQMRVKLEGDKVSLGVKQVVPEKHTTCQADNGRMEEANATVTPGMSASEHGKGDVEKMIELLNANVKSGIAYSDFKIFDKDLVKVGRRFSVPPRLAPIAHKIEEHHGDIAKPSSQSDCAANPSFILLCAAIQEMDDLKLHQINETKILLWRDAINSALNLRFEVGFTVNQLKRIARAYFDLKATQGKMELPSESEAHYFRGKPLSAGLFDH